MSFEATISCIDCTSVQRSVETNSRNSHLWRPDVASGGLARCKYFFTSAPEPLYLLNHHDQRARIAFVCFYNNGDVAYVRALQICQAQ